jgi:hypothetical protein
MSPQWPSHVRHGIFAIHRMAPINIAVHDAALRKHGNRSVGLALRTKIVRQFCRGDYRMSDARTAQCSVNILTVSAAPQLRGRLERD